MRAIQDFSLTLETTLQVRVLSRHSMSLSWNY